MIEGLIAFVIAALVIGLIAGVLILLVRRAPFIPADAGASTFGRGYLNR